MHESPHCLNASMILGDNRADGCAPVCVSQKGKIRAKWEKKDEFETSGGEGRSKEALKAEAWLKERSIFEQCEEYFKDGKVGMPLVALDEYRLLTSVCLCGVAGAWQKAVGHRFRGSAGQGIHYATELALYSTSSNSNSSSRNSTKGSEAGRRCTGARRQTAGFQTWRHWGCTPHKHWRQHRAAGTQCSGHSSTSFDFKDGGL